MIGGALAFGVGARWPARWPPSRSRGASPACARPPTASRTARSTSRSSTTRATRSATWRARWRRCARASRRSSARARRVHRQRLARAAHAADGARRLPRAAHGGRPDRGGAQRVPRDDGRAGAAAHEARDRSARPLAARRRRLHGRPRGDRARRARGRLRARDAGARGPPRLGRRRRGPGAPALARGDEGRVLQVLRVLVDNAVRHTPPGSTSRCAPRRTPWGASVIVSDNGPGIPARGARSGLRALLPRPGGRGARLGPRPRDRARAGRAHGRPPARVERPGRDAASRSSCPARWATTRPPTLSPCDDTRAVLASGVAIALVAGIAGGALALALDGDDGASTTVVTTVVRSGGREQRRRLRSRRRSMPNARHGVVTIECEPSPATTRRWAAASWWTRARGLIVTASHVVAKRPARARPAGRERRLRRARTTGHASTPRLLGYDLFEDTALLAGRSGASRAARAAARACSRCCAWATRSP